MARKWPQFLAAICICIGAVCTGVMVGWTNTIESEMRAGQYGFKINDTEMGIISSTMTLGAATACFPTGFLLPTLGRKWTCLLTIVPFTVGYLLIIFARNVSIYMLYVGRYLVGIGGGTFCIAAPVYTMEIAHTSIRGMLGTFFQLLLTMGILLTFITGWVFSLTVHNIISAVIPFVFFACFFFQPESPVITVKRGKQEKAEKVIKYFKGQDYDTAGEIKSIQEDLAKEEQAKTTFKETIKKKNSKRAILICLMEMFFQQFSGINVVMFYSSEVFKAARTGWDPRMQSVLVGAMQVIITLISSVTIDRFGRKILLILSEAVMAVCLVVLGIFFLLKERIYVEHEHDLDSISWLPLLSTCLYVVGFSIGMGPIPWMLVGEIFPYEIKSTMGALGGTLNWLMAFTIGILFPPLRTAIGGDVCFFFFAVVCVFGVVFAIFVVPETKNKTFAEVQAELGG